MNQFVEILTHSLLITGFVFIMMLLIEYINVQTHGSWQEKLKKGRIGQYVLAVALGAIPGCLGAFTVVSLYAHGVVSFGALVATMIATSGDEAFVMLSIFPVKAIFLTVIISVIGFAVGYVTDLVYKKQDKLLTGKEHPLPIHDEKFCNCYPKGYILKQLKEITFERVLLIGFLSLFVILFLTGSVMSEAVGWIKITILGGSLFALFVVTTVPDHFLQKHLWEHVLKKHLLRIFLWTFGALLVIHILMNYIDLDTWIHTNTLMVLTIAVLIGIIPESGPHLILVTLFAQGSLPFSILLASSIVQDGHGTLPLLAVSKRGFIILKIINVAAGFALGMIGMLFGF
jgi:hypothetical protein